MCLSVCPSHFLSTRLQVILLNGFFTVDSLTLLLATRVNRRMFIAFYPNREFTCNWQLGARYHRGLTRIAGQGLKDVDLCKDVPFGGLDDE